LGGDCASSWFGLEEAWIRDTQVGDPLAHCLKGGTNRAIAYRSVLLASLSVAEAEDKEVGNFPFLSMDVTEGRGMSEVLAEAGPDAEDLGLGLDAFGSLGNRGVLESNAEFSIELISSGRVSIFQGSGCGYAC